MYVEDEYTSCNRIYQIIYLLTRIIGLKVFDAIKQNKNELEEKKNAMFIVYPTVVTRVLSKQNTECLADCGPTCGLTHFLVFDVLVPLFSRCLYISGYTTFAIKMTK